MIDRFVLGVLYKLSAAVPTSVVLFASVDSAIQGRCVLTHNLDKKSSLPHQEELNIDYHYILTCLGLPIVFIVFQMFNFLRIQVLKFSTFWRFKI